ncbi:putative Protein IWS1-like protein [Hypsibius exemplaris]|uniref:TFIIS N-terminal domain-containing protein n=1 Tax=Hypsibius exemplaris TaxID=2072580 RepID=A0A1W0X7T0_HYPEX|nr:putative Protein IWS1-like protein [Hypsibius exemplaris]
MEFTGFEDGNLDGFGSSSGDVFGEETPGGSQLNNPLGLSDKDMELQYESLPAGGVARDSNAADQDAEEDEEESNDKVSRDKEHESEREEPKSDTVEGIQEETVETEADDDDATEPSQEAEAEDAAAAPAAVSVEELFGSDVEDEDDEAAEEQPADAAEDGAGNGEDYHQPGAAGGGTNADADSDGGSIKSDYERPNNDQMSDFDLMMEQKRAERRRSFKRKGRKGDEDLGISDYDQRIQEIILEMKKAAEDDRKANQRNECAFSKLKMLPEVVRALQKLDLHAAFLDGGILSALADWLAPLPDGNLTHLKIRESILKLLGDMSGIEPTQLKNSGIGKAVMLLYKHPKELRENRAKAGKLIQEWSRPIFGTSTNYTSMTREEREQRDLELLKKRRESLDGSSSSTPAKKKRKSESGGGEGEDEEEDPNREIPRARVPRPSLKDYVHRPKSQMLQDEEEEPAAGSRARRSTGAKPKNRFDQRMRGMKDQSRASKMMGGHISISGSKM